MMQRATIAAAAIERLLRPVVRLALAFGVKYPALDRILRDLLIAESNRAMPNQRRARPNVSQLAVMTGLSRVDIKERISTARRAPLPATELSYAAKTFTLWTQKLHGDASLRSIPLSGQEALSFETLSREATRGNVHHRAVLSELVRLGMAQVEEDRVSLLAQAFVPAGDAQVMLSFLADNTRDHLNAAVSNVIGGQPPFLERVVFSQGIAERDCVAAMATMRSGWNRVHASLVPQLNQAVDTLGAEAPFRIRLGVYAYYEPWDEDAPFDDLDALDSLDDEKPA